MENNPFHDPQFPFVENQFLQNWWWEALCRPENLKVFRLESDGISAFWPLAKIRRLGVFHVYGAPPLTQHTGPWLGNREDFAGLLEQLPPRLMLCVNLGFSLNSREVEICNRKGIRASEKVTHRICRTEDADFLFGRIAPSQQRQIRKARKYLHLSENPQIDDLIRLQEQTFRRRGMKVPYSEEDVRRLWDAVQKNRSGELVSLADNEGKIRACGLFVYDKQACYSLAHGFDKTEKNVGAGSLLQWEGILIASRMGLVFDFEGSNIESIARFNLSFGADPFYYTHLERYTPLFRNLLKIRERMRNP